MGGAQTESGEIDQMAIYWADGESFRLRECPGNNQNVAIWAAMELKEACLPNDLIMAELGRRKESGPRWFRRA